MTKIFFYPTSPNAIIPQYQTAGSAGFDLAVSEDVDLQENQQVLAATDLVVQIPSDTVLLLLPRSSTFKKWNITLPNSAGVIDSDYCGKDDKLFVPVVWHGMGSNIIPQGTRIAQGLIVPVVQADIEVLTEYNQNLNRGGFGSTGEK